MDRPPEPAISLLAVAEMLCRQKWFMAGFAAVVLAATVLAMFLVPPLYRSEAKLFVRLGRENVALDPTSTLGQGPVVAVPQSREEEINSVIEILQSREVLTRVVEHFGPAVILGQEPYVPDRPEPSAAARPDDLDTFLAVRQLSEDLAAETPRRSNVVQVVYKANSPELAQAVLRELIAGFLDLHAQLNRTPGAYEFLRDQTQRVERQLAETEQGYVRLKADTGVFAAAEQRDLLIKRISSLEDDLLKAESEATAAKAEVARLQQQLENLPATAATSHTDVPNQTADALRTQLYTLQLQEQDLLGKHPESHPSVLAIRRQVAEARRLLAQEPPLRRQTTEGVSRLREETQLALLKQEPLLAALSARADALRRQLRDENSRLRDLDRHSLPLEELKQKLELYRGHYRRYSDSLEQAQIDQTMRSEKITNIGLVQPPSCEVKAVWPNKLLFLAGGAFLAQAGAVGLAFLRERFDSTLKTPADVQRRLDLPVLATLPALPPSGVAARDPAGHWAAAPALATGCQDLLAGLARPADGGYLLGLTGVAPGAGVSTLSAQLALTAAGLGKRVLLVDANPDGPPLAKALGVEPGPGWAGALRAGKGLADAFRPVNGPGNLCLLPAGAAEDAPELLARAVEGLKEFRADFDLIVIDLPATTQPALARELCGRADGVVLVIPAETTPQDVVGREAELLTRARVPLVGAVLNRQRTYVPAWLRRAL